MTVQQEELALLHESSPGGRYIGPERMAQLQTWRFEGRGAPPFGSWGLWDQHLLQWVPIEGYGSEREAWKALLALDYVRPWDLQIAQAGKDKLPAPPPRVTCHRCNGNKDCSACSGTGDCPECDGEGSYPE